mmetsp:Transcript_54532/g.65633  ORF Transcript_54532/g.65633 Transcript_54532/m.65633 type:complete len:102 (+) Transcript_54532:75-380(+)
MSRNKNVNVKHTKIWNYGLEVPLNWKIGVEAATLNDHPQLLFHKAMHGAKYRRYDDRPRPTRHTVEYERPALRNDRVMRTPTFIEFIVVAIPRWENQRGLA